MQSQEIPQAPLTLIPLELLGIPRPEGFPFWLGDRVWIPCEKCFGIVAGIRFVSYNKEWKYTIESNNGLIIQGTFYASELILVQDTYPQDSQENLQKLEDEHGD